MAKARILILCTGNSARSQMAEGLLKSFDPTLEVSSAGPKPAERIHPVAIKVMREIGIDISQGIPKSVNQYVQQSFDFVITVCDDAERNCPMFTGTVKKQLHRGFADPARASGSDEEVLTIFRRVRDEIESSFFDFYCKEMKNYKLS